MRCLATGPQRGNRTPRQRSELGQVNFTTERHRHSTLADVSEHLRGYVQVDLSWLTAGPFHDLDMHAPLLRGFQDKFGHGSPVAVDLTVAARPLTTAKEQ